jgi:hypothetical protein
MDRCAYLLLDTILEGLSLFENLTARRLVAILLGAKFVQLSTKGVSLLISLASSRGQRYCLLHGGLSIVLKRLHQKQKTQMRDVTYQLFLECVDLSLYPLQLSIMRSLVRFA